MAKRIEERFAFSGSVGDGDRSHVIEGVLLCGATSANRRRYRREAFAGDRVKRYEGRPVYLNHGRGRDGRPYQEMLGVVENARLNADGLPVGDVVVNPKKPFAEAVLWDAKNKPKACGMSHVAQCETVRGKDGWEEITEVVSVESVDLVTDPATTKGFRENKGSAVPNTIRQFAEQLSRHPKATTDQILRAKRLSETDGMGDVATDAAAPEEADPAEGVKTAFKSAIMHLVDGCLSDGGDPKECLAKVKKLIAGHGEVNGKAEPEGGAGGEGGEEGAAAKGESRRKPADPIAVLTECKALGYEPGIAELKALCLMEAADRTAHVREQLKKSADSRAEKPKSGPPARRVAEQKAAEVKDLKSFMESITA